MQAYVTLEEKHVMKGGRENSWKIEQLCDCFQECISGSWSGLFHKFEAALAKLISWPIGVSLTCTDLLQFSTSVIFG